MAPIYTKSGDSGETGLFGGGRVRKDDASVEAYGQVDELNAAIGLARAAGLDGDLDAVAQSIQEQLFTLGAVLATPPGTKAEGVIPKVDARWAAEMESTIDRYDREISPLRNFILPGGSAGAAGLHLARTVCRRAERRVVALSRLMAANALPRRAVDPQAVVYLNRLSDLLFTMARVSNHRSGVKDVPWNPPKPQP
jgi:cob(I)alamin adenosyltransferase